MVVQGERSPGQNPAYRPAHLPFSARSSALSIQRITRKAQDSGDSAFLRFFSQGPTPLAARFVRRGIMSAGIRSAEHCPAFFFADRWSALRRTSAPHRRGRRPWRPVTTPPPRFAQHLPAVVFSLQNVPPAHFAAGKVLTQGRLFHVRGRLIATRSWSFRVAPTTHLLGAKSSAPDAPRFPTRPDPRPCRRRRP